MNVNMQRAVENLAKKDLKFLQPLYEAISNSLESGSSKILVELFTDDTLSAEIEPHIISFSVTDNGDGFTEDNIASFLELWSDTKLELGCKGSGRFTWLSVFDRVEITSEVASESKLVTIPFGLKFRDSDIGTSTQYFSKNKTTVKFCDVTKRYYDIDSKIDNRSIADLDAITNGIEQSLIIKLFLLKRDGVKFSIKIKLNEQEREINEATIPTLEYKQFEIASKVIKETYEFELYYHFIDDRKNSKKIYYCANRRTVKEEDDDSLHFSCELPNKTSFNMLLCSRYLDDMVNDSRNDFAGMAHKKQASMACPLLFTDIKPELLKQMQIILLEKFPELEALNKEQEEKAINASPYLTKYIKENGDLVKTEKSLTTKAIETFNKQKAIVKSKFEKLLHDKSIDEHSFNEAVVALSEVAAAELGEYILYRNSIIKALECAISDESKKEKFIHDIFMPMHTSSFSSNEEKHFLSNLWILDDKFMTYSYAASDETVEAIKRDIEIKNNEKFKDSNRPDLTIFFNSKTEHRNLIMIEFKGANANKYEKNKALTELPDDVAIVKKHIPNINTVWSYIITTIDDDFKFSISNQDFIELFTANSEYCAYYKYFNKQNAHEFILDLKTITSDAFARNKIFMDILKRQ